MDIRVLALIAPVITVIVALVYLGRKLNTRVKKDAPNSTYSRQFTQIGVCALLTGPAFILLCLAAYTLLPNSPIGSLLRTTDGVILTIAASIFGSAAIYYLLGRMGYSLTIND